MNLTVRSVTPGAIAVLEAPELASIHGGGVAVRQGPDGRLVPEGAVYRTILDMDSGIAVSSGPRRGSVTISGDRESTMSRIWRRAVAVAMREAGP